MPEHSPAITSVNMAGMAEMLVNNSSYRLDYGDGAFLQVLQPAHATRSYVDGLNDPDVFKHMGVTRETRQTLDTVRDYIVANLEAPDAILFGNFIAGDLRGTVRLYEIDPTERTATIGTALFDKAVWGMGWGSRALRQSAAFGFEFLNLQAIFAGIYSRNEGSRRSFSRAGFVHDPSRDREDAFDLIETWVATPGDFVDGNDR